MFGPQEKF